MTPRYFEFYSPMKILSGDHALRQIPFELRRLGVRRLMVLAGGTARRARYFKELFADLEENGIAVGALVEEVPVDSSLDFVNQCGLLYQEKGCDGILAIGGGSVLDTAKGVKIVAAHGGEDIRNFMGSEAIPKGKTVPLVAVPTTVGTGSEATNVAVIADKANGVKLEFVSGTLLPDVAVLDPKVVRTLPPRLTASTAADALTHSIEAYTGLQKNPISDAYAFASVQMIAINIRKALSKNNNQRALNHLANAALMAGVAFSNSMVGLAHAIGHSCGGVCGTPHGDAMAVLLPHVMEFNMEAVEEEYSQLLLALAGPEVYAETRSRQRGRKAVENVREILQYLHKKSGLPLTLQGLGVHREAFPAIVKGALNDGAILFNPQQATAADIMQLLEDAY